VPKKGRGYIRGTTLVDTINVSNLSLIMDIYPETRLSVSSRVNHNNSIDRNSFSHAISSLNQFTSYVILFFHRFYVWNSINII